jgi:hypothetical protein
MIIYEDDTLVIPVGIGANASDISNALQEKDVTITSNTTTTVTPDEGYVGISKLNIKTEIPTEVNNQEKSVTVSGSSTNTVYPDSGYTGLSSVNITSEVNLQNKFAKIVNTGATVITYDEGFDGLNSVEVFVDVPLSSIEFDSSTNPQRVVTDSSGYCDITVKPYSVEDVYVDSSTAAQTIRPTNTDGFKNIYVNPLTLNPIQITPTKTAQVHQGAYDFIHVSPVTSSIDSNIVPENIRKDTVILGVTGTLEAIGDREELTVDASTSTQVYTPHQGYVGFSKVTVNGYTDCYTALFDESIQEINLTPANLRGLKHVANAAFANNNAGSWRTKFNNITFPNTVETVSSYPFNGAIYNTISFYDTNISVWPGEQGFGATYPNFVNSTISSVIFPKKLRGFYRRTSYVFDTCTIAQINLNPCTNLYGIERLITNSTVSEIIIPASCYEVSYLAKDCSQLTDIYCYATRPPTVSYLVENIKVNGVLHVPSGYRQSYLQSDWMDSNNTHSLAYYGWTVVADL